MDEREGFVKDSKVAFKGILNGIIGSSLYQTVISLFISLIVVFVVSGENPDVSSEQLEILVDAKMDSFPFGLILSCIGSVITLGVFIIIIKWNNFKELFKKAINSKTLKYGVICAICIMAFSIIYNNLAMNIFNLEDGGNANQDGVSTLVKTNAFLGFLAVVVLAPVVEELTYRYCIFGELCKYKKWIGYLVSGVIFMLMHAISSYTQAGGFNAELLKELVYLPPYLFSGLALCYVYDKTSNIGASAVAHILNNLVSFLVIVLL